MPADETPLPGAGSGDRGPDLPAIRAAIRADPAARFGWLALAGWFADHGDDDRAAIVRAYWHVLRDTAAEGRDAVETLLRFQDRDVRRLAWRAREAEDRRTRD